MATKLAPYSQLGFVITPFNFPMISGDLRIQKNKNDEKADNKNTKTYFEFNERYAELMRGS